MPFNKTKSLLLLAFLLLPLAISQGLTAPFATTPSDGPIVTKVEPPSWWPGHSINPVRIMIRGQHLGGAKLESPTSALSFGTAKSNEASTYLFVDVNITTDCAPGSYPLKIQTQTGTTEASFELLEPLPRAGRFQGFSSDDVIYLIMPDRFANGDSSNDEPAGSEGLTDRARQRYYHGGDLQGVIDRLPYLKDLGVTALWLNPWYNNVNHLNDKETYGHGPITDYHGYGAVDFYSVEEHFGSLAKLQELVEKAHQQGIKIIQDQVANHTGPYHPWVTDSPTKTWFNGTASDHLANNWQVWTLADPYSNPQIQKQTLDGWFIDVLPDLNQGDPEVARYLIQNTLWWVGVTGLDGIRQDTLPYVPRVFWSKWRQAIYEEYPDVSVVGEMWDGEAGLLSFFQGGQTRFDGVDSNIEAVFDFPLFYAARDAFTRKTSIRDLAKAFSRDRLYPAPDKLMTFIGLHDVPRFMDEEGADLPGLKMAFALLLTARGIPVIYYGDEIAMPGSGDPDNRRDFPGGWPTDRRNAFSPEGRSHQENDLHQYMRKLIRLRTTNQPLQKGKTVHLSTEEQIYAFSRVLEEGAAIVVFNNDTVEQLVRFHLPEQLPGIAAKTALTDQIQGQVQARIHNKVMELVIPGRSAALFTLGHTPH